MSLTTTSCPVKRKSRRTPAPFSRNGIAADNGRTAASMDAGTGSTWRSQRLHAYQSAARPQPAAYISPT